MNFLSITCARARRFLSALSIVLAAAAASTAIAQTAPPSPATPAPPSAEALEIWRATLPKSPPAENGCYTAQYPDASWHKAPCVTPPNVPYVPVRALVRAANPGLVGNGNDYVAATANPITSATGSFNAVTGVINEADQGTANRYSLQLNTNTFSNTPACNGAKSPPNCVGWEQFVYSNSGTAFIQYWLIGYAATCPQGWNTFGADCWTNAPTAAAYGPQPITSLQGTQLSGFAIASGKDTISISGPDGKASAANTDSVLSLAKFWNNAEFNVVGDCCGSEADFNSGVSITVKTTVNSGTTAAPTCNVAGTTGEGNNLDLPSTCATKSHLQTGGGPAIVFTETNPPGSIWQWKGAGCSGTSCPSWSEFDNNNQSVRIATTDGKLAQLWNNGEVWLSTGTACSNGSCPGWTNIDNNANTYAIYAGGDNIYQLQNNGTVQQYTSGSSWTTLDINTTIVTLAAASGGLYELHNKGQIWKSTGQACSGSSCPGWQELDNNPKAVAIAASENNLFEMHNDGTIWEFTGKVCTSSGCPGWQQIANNANAVVMAAGGTTVYELDTTGDIWEYVGPACNSTSCPGWKLVDDNPAALNIAADSVNLYELHNTGKLWRFTGTVCNGSSCPGWELIDNNSKTGRITASAGNLYQLHVVMTPPSRSLSCYDCR